MLRIRLLVAGPCIQIRIHQIGLIRNVNMVTSGAYRDHKFLSKAKLLFELVSASLSQECKLFYFGLNNIIVMIYKIFIFILSHLKIYCKPFLYIHLSVCLIACFSIFLLSCQLLHSYGQFVLF